ncbi:MAG: radical SAM protein [Planctomycetaceae bacterium]|jgi:nitrogen fixation protein NifB|nr:radical SAM protein [Planctomycetaceae bacterium]
MNFDNHPCFNALTRHSTGRIHLPVAARCNIQCNFCNRKYDCVNESRPGVTSAILTPAQAIRYLDAVLEKVENLAVIGIAGPGDPFANPKETMQTLELVHEKYPDKILCLATNGLGLPEYAEQISQRNVSHVTITLNAVDPRIGSEIYAWVRPAVRTIRGVEGAKFLLKRQTEAIKELKKRDIAVKVNTVIIPEINDEHAVEVAAFCKELGVDVQNCIPLMHVESTTFEGRPLPTSADMIALRMKASQYVRQMSHCARCRADAAGLIGVENSLEFVELLQNAAIVQPTKERPYIAVGSREGLFVNRHLGEAPSLWVFGTQEDKIILLEQRPTPIPGTGDSRWLELAETLKDCAAVLVSGCGPNPQRILEEKGVSVIAMEGLIAESLPYVFAGQKLPKIITRSLGVCSAGSGCKNVGGGCE